MRKLPSLEDIHKNYYYNKYTGEFIRARNLRNRHIGEVVSGSLTNGYAYLYINGGCYAAHRIAWKIEFSDPGAMQVDHINHIRNDNRISNLRLVTNKDNCRNISISKRSKTGFVGVLWRESAKRFRSHIMIDGKEIHLGYSKTLVDAVIKRIKANEKYGFHENHGML